MLSTLSLRVTVTDSRLASNAVVSSLFDGASTHRTIYPLLDARSDPNVVTSANSTTSTGYIFVVAKGNYKNTTYSPSGIPVVNGVYTFADGSKIENIVAAKKFAIAKLAFDKDDVTISNGSLGGGQIDFVEKNCFEQSNIEIKVKMK